MRRTWSGSFFTESVEPLFVLAAFPGAKRFTLLLEML
jgi:hypothetical protein